MTIHPARTMAFADLVDGLSEATAAKLVNEQIGDDGLRLYCYSQSAVYDRVWTPFTLMARGLILDVDRESVVATPFPKFFNVGEGEQTIPDQPFETFEKVDGSLIIIFWHDGEWRTATKGSLRSGQATWAAERVTNSDTSQLTRGVTYLAEAIYPENRIVVHYEEEGLVLLAAYDEGGQEISFDALCEVGDRLGWRTAKRHGFDSVSDLIATAGTLPASEEGFVVRFADGLRLKVKGEEYRRIHALISHVTPLAMWNAMLADDDLNAIRRDLPEEFWADFDSITGLLSKQRDAIVEAVRREASAVSGLSDKEVGLRLSTFSDNVRRLIFPYRKGGDLLSGRYRQAVFNAIRPTGNRLPGYQPSYAINRVMEDAA